MSDLKTRYKGSVLGFLWTFVNPLLSLVVYTLVFSTIAKVKMVHYSSFLFIGILVWNMFSSAVLSSTRVIISQAGLVKKIYFPREILPLSVVGGSLVNYLLSLIIMIPFLFLTGYRPTINWLYAPEILIMLLLLMVGLALFFSSITVYLRDTEHMLSVIMMLWFYLTPIFYSLENLSSKYQALIKLNPVVPAIDSLQEIFYYNSPPRWKLCVYGYIVALVIFVIGWSLFQRLSGRFAEEV